MKYVSLYRKYRSTTFEEIVGQSHITTTLQHAIEQNRIAHAYLFSGPRGTGKTSTARIFAKALNCAHGPAPIPCNKCDICLAITSDSLFDVIEIDAASNRGIDDIRDLREKVRVAPIQARYKIYIIDEVHMLTREAFNALLKTLEEPPASVIFIMATTEPQKLLPTILSRCQRFEFRRIPEQTIGARLRHIADHEGVSVEDGALFSIVKSADGSMRDAISIFDQLVAFGGSNVTSRDVAQVFGLVERAEISNFMKSVFDADAAAALALFDSFFLAGKSFNLFIRILMEHVRDLYLIKQGIKPASDAYSSDENLKTMREQAGSVSAAVLVGILDELAKTEDRIRWETYPRIVLEIMIIRLIETACAAPAADSIAAPQPTAHQTKQPAAPPAPQSESKLQAAQKITTEKKSAAFPDFPKPSADRPAPPPQKPARETSRPGGVPDSVADKFRQAESLFSDPAPAPARPEKRRSEKSAREESTAPEDEHFAPPAPAESSKVKHSPAEHPQADSKTSEPKSDLQPPSRVSPPPKKAAGKSAAPQSAHAAADDFDPYEGMPDPVEDGYTSERARTSPPRSARPEKQRAEPDYVPPIENGNFQPVEDVTPELRPSGSPDLDGVISLWPEILCEIKKNHLPVYFLIAQGVPVAVDGNLLTVRFDSEHRFHKLQSLEDDNRKTIEKTINEITGRKYILVGETSEPDGGNGERNSAEENEQTEKTHSAGGARSSLEPEIPETVPSSGNAMPKPPEKPPESLQFDIPEPSRQATKPARAGQSELSLFDTMNELFPGNIEID